MNWLFKYFDKLCTFFLSLFLIVSLIECKPKEKGNSLYFDINDNRDEVSRLIFLWLVNRKYDYEKDIDFMYVFSRLLYFLSFGLVLGYRFKNNFEEM